jgi:hypothetical protein
LQQLAFQPKPLQNLVAHYVSAYLELIHLIAGMAEHILTIS